MALIFFFFFWLKNPNTLALKSEIIFFLLLSIKIKLLFKTTILK